jgi:hypothetical protein
MQTILAFAFAGLTALGTPAVPDPVPHVQRVQQTTLWAGSWIYAPEIRKGVTRNNQSSVELLQGWMVRYCLNDYCADVQYAQNGEIYSFVTPSIIPSYYEFWLGDFNSLEGRMWFGKTAPQGAPDAMVRMRQQ